MLSKIRGFFNSVKEEIKETKEALRIIKDRVLKGKRLSIDEKKIVQNQLIDVFKTILVILIFLIPGGSLILILIGFIKLNKFILPSSFKKK